MFSFIKKYFPKEGYNSIHDYFSFSLLYSLCIIGTVRVTGLIGSLCLIVMPPNADSSDDCPPAPVSVMNQPMGLL